MVLTECVFLVSVRGYFIVQQLFSNFLLLHQSTPTVIIGLSSLKHSGYYRFEENKRLKERGFFLLLFPPTGERSNSMGSKRMPETKAIYKWNKRKRSIWQTHYKIVKSIAWEKNNWNIVCLRLSAFSSMFYLELDTTCAVLI